MYCENVFKVVIKRKCKDRRDNRYDAEPLAPIGSTTVTDYRVMPSDCGGYLKAEIQTERETLTLIDYASAGNTWQENAIFASWIPLE